MPAGSALPGSAGDAEIAATPEPAPALPPDPDQANLPDGLPDDLEGFEEPPEAMLAGADGLADDVPEPVTLTVSTKDRASDFLIAYFKDLTRLTVLNPTAEYELARRIGIMEEVLWVQLLSFAPLCDYLLDLLEGAMKKSLPEFAAVRAGAAALLQEGKHTSKELSQGAGPLAARLRQFDADRLYVSAVLEEIKTLDRALKDGTRHESFPAAKFEDLPWRIYVDGIAVIDHLVKRAKDEFVRANLRLVVSIARRFNFGRMPLADLIQEGNMGLLKAVERFDYRRGYRFSTYASWWIRHAISRGLADKSRVVRLPVHTIAEFHNVMRTKRKLARELGRQATNEELSHSTGLKLDKINKMDSYLVDDAVSLDREVSEYDKRSFIDFLQDDSVTHNASEKLISEAMLAEVQHLLTELTPIEADILRMRFGLDSDQELTLKEIGEKYSLSRERIRQLQEQALSRMRRALARKDLL